MRKVTLSDVKYQVYPVQEDIEYRNDKHYIGGKLVSGQSLTTEPYGYIIVDNEAVLCYSDSKLRKHTLIVSVGILCLLLVLTLTVLVFPVKLPEFNVHQNRDNVIEDLDFGVSKLSGKVKYSRYAIYDGEAIGVYISTPMKGKQFAVSTESYVTEYSDSTRITAKLNMQVNDVAEGELLVKDGEDVKSYPIIIEYLQPAKLDLPKGEASEEVPEVENDLENFSTYSVVSPKER